MISPRWIFIAEVSKEMNDYQRLPREIVQRIVASLLLNGDSVLRAGRRTAGKEGTQHDACDDQCGGCFQFSHEGWRLFVEIGDDFDDAFNHFRR